MRYIDCSLNNFIHGHALLKKIITMSPMRLYTFQVRVYVNFYPCSVDKEGKKLYPETIVSLI